jgi:hypothetical protein
MKNFTLLCLLVSLILISCGKSTATNQMTEQANIVQTMVATISQVMTPGQTMPAPTNPGGTPIPTNSGPNPEHLSKLMEGVDAWNEWRTQNPSIIPDLNYAILTEAELFGINLKKAKLFKAQLNNANLGKANLGKANLSKANLVAVNLVEANLIEANLVGANLDKANLNSALLYGADLTNAILTGAKLTNSKYNATTKWPEGFDPVAAGAKLIVPK